MITIGDIKKCGKIEKHIYETYDDHDQDFKRYTFIGVKIDLSKDKWALLEVNREDGTVGWRLFEKNWSLAKKPTSGPCSDGHVYNMFNGCYPLLSGTETQKRDLWEYCDDAERAVLVMHPLFHMNF